MWMVQMESHCPFQKALHFLWLHRRAHLNGMTVSLCDMNSLNCGVSLPAANLSGGISLPAVSLRQGLLD